MVSGTQDTFLDERKALTCIHCGLCLSACPTYLETGDENDSPRGRIYLMRALQDGRVPLEAAVVTHLDRCLGCRACETACPSGVEYGTLIEAARNHIEHHYRRSPFQTFLRRFVIEKIFPHPGRLRFALLPAMIVRGLGLEFLLPQFARNALALVPDDWDSDDPPQHLPPLAEPKGRVAMVDGCVMSVLFSQTNASTARLIHRAGFQIVGVPRQRCCGALHAHSGQLEQARELARQNIAAFEDGQLDAIVINAAGCGSTLKEYGHLLENDPQYAERARHFSGKVKDLAEFLTEHPPTHPVPSKPDDDRPAPPPEPYATAGKVTWHDACHLAHPQGITAQPRELVKRIAGDRFVELPEADVCCGSAGSYNLTEPEMAARLQKRKIGHLLETGAHTVVTSNPGCILQIRAGLKQAGRDDIQVLHLADYLETHR